MKHSPSESSVPKKETGINYPKSQPGSQSVPDPQGGYTSRDLKLGNGTDRCGTPLVNMSDQQRTTAGPLAGSSVLGGDYLLRAVLLIPDENSPALRRLVIGRGAASHFRLAVATKPPLQL